MTQDMCDKSMQKLQPVEFTSNQTGLMKMHMETIKIEIFIKV